MSKERYKYTTDIVELSHFENIKSIEKEISAQKDIYTENDKGYNIEVANGYACDGIVTIDLRYGADGQYVVENRVKLNTNSKMRLVIYHHSTENVKIKEDLFVELGVNASLEVVEVVDTRSTILSDINVNSRRDSRITISVLDINNQCVIRNQHIDLEESGAECTLNGLYITSGKEHVDNYVKVRHAVPNCTSNQLFKGVLSDNSDAAFTGHILVEKDAQKTAAYQQNHNIILSDFARVNSRPQLEIYADDVKCNHGATVGKLDPEAIYYMRQRGISPEAARRLQLIGFAEDVVRLEDFEGIHAVVHQKITQKLASI